MLHSGGERQNYLKQSFSLLLLYYQPCGRGALNSHPVVLTCEVVWVFAIFNGFITFNETSEMELCSGDIRERLNEYESEIDSLHSSDDETNVLCDSDHESDCSSQYSSMLKALYLTIISEIIENSKRSG